MYNFDNKVTVIIPTYNSEKFIERTLLSLENQKELPDEIIFSDDGSEDKTIQIIELWVKEQKKIKYKILKNTHKGPGHARNEGIINAQNNWIAFLDSDDTWENDKIYEVKKIMEQKKNINFITHFEFNVDLKNKKKEISKKLKIFLQQKTDLKKFLFISNIFSTSAVTCKKDILIKNKMFDVKLQNAQDYDLWLKLSPHINLYVIEKNLGTYYDTPNNITSRPYFKKIKAELIISLRYRKLVNTFFFLKKIFKIFINKNWFKI